MEQLIALKKQTKKSGDQDELARVKEMMGEEKSIKRAMAKKRDEVATLKRLKDENK